MAIRITLTIGTHDVQLTPDGESLKASFTWHQPVYIHSWTWRKLEEWAEASVDEGDYGKAERAFIIRATGNPPKQLGP